MKRLDPENLQPAEKSLDSGPAVEFDIDAWFEEKFGDE